MWGLLLGTLYGYFEPLLKKKQIKIKYRRRLRRVIAAPPNISQRIWQHQAEFQTEIIADHCQTIAEQRALSEECCSDFRLELCTLCSFEIIEAHDGVLANFWNGMFVFVYSGYRAYSEKC